MNNTITPKQVDVMENEIDSIMSRAKTELESTMIDFNQTIKECWADEVAVSFAKKVSNSMNGVISDMAKNTNNAKRGIIDVANQYAMQAHKPMMNAARTVSYYSAINPSVVKSTFDDGDTYGLRDDSSFEKISNSVADLIKKCYKIGSEASSNLRTINAFGNHEISQKIQSVAEQLGSSMGSSVNSIMKIARESLEAVKKGYGSVIDTSISQIDGITTNASDISSFDIL